MSRKIFSHCPFFIHPRGLHVLKTIDRKVLSLRLSVLLPAVAGVCGKNCNSVHSLPAWMTCQASNDCPISSELVSVTLKMESGGRKTMAMETMITSHEEGIKQLRGHTKDNNFCMFATVDETGVLRLRPMTIQKMEGNRTYTYL